MKFSQSLRVGPADIDEQEHVNNVVFLRWIQDVAVAHWRHSASPEMVERFSWVVVRHEIDYKRQGFAGDEITATTWVGEWTKVTCERFTEITRGSEMLVSSRTLWCMIDRASNRPARISEEVRERFS